MAVVKVSGVPYHIDRKLKNKWDDIKDGTLAKDDDDRVFIVDGRERSGESLYRLASAKAKAFGRDVILLRDMDSILVLYQRFLDDIFKDEDGTYHNTRVEQGRSYKEAAGSQEAILLEALNDLYKKPENRQWRKQRKHG